MKPEQEWATMCEHEMLLNVIRIERKLWKNIFTTTIWFEYSKESTNIRL